MKRRRGTCVAGMAATIGTLVAAGGSVSAAEPDATPSARRIVVKGAEAGTPVGPQVFAGDLRQLPLRPAWQPGDPIKEIPRRFVPPEGPLPPEPGPHADPGSSTLSQLPNIVTAEFDSSLCGWSTFECVPQPGTATRLDPLREVVMWRLAYRNFGGHESMFGNFVTDVDGADHAGVRWFELRKSAAGAWALHQEGTYAPDDEHRWMASVAADGDGGIALGYSISSSSLYPSISFTGRRITDGLGLMTQAESVLATGSGYHAGNRWGDYSAMSIDPEDDCTFWYTNEYALSNHGWATRIGAFRFDSCTGLGSGVFADGFEEGDTGRWSGEMPTP